MRKQNLIPFILIALLLVACAGGVASEAMAPQDYGMPGGGDEVYYEVEAEEIMAEYDDSAVADTTAQSAVPETAERVVIKNAEISISVGDPAETMDAVMLMAEQMGGFVVSSNLYFTHLSNGQEVPRANVTIRVPAERLTEALEQIETGAGRVLSKNVSGQDVTREYTDLQSRLRNLQDAEAQLSEIMGSATKTEDVLDVFNQLTYIREQIEVIEGQIQYFQQSAAFSAINVEIMTDAAVQPLTIGGWEPVGVAKDAVQALIDTLQGLVDFLIWFALYILPVAVVILVPLWFVGRSLKRLWARRRAAKRPAPPVE